MSSSDDSPDPEDYASPFEQFIDLLKKEQARQKRLALKRREILLAELASIEDEYGLPRTKLARHKSF